MKRINNIVGFFIATGLLFLSGCSSNTGLITSLEDLNTNYKKEGIKLPQTRVISVSGFLPFSETGGLYHFKAQRKPASAIGVSPDKSFILTNEIPYNGGISDLTSIRDALLLLKNLAEKNILDKLELTRLRYEETSESSEIVAAKTKYETSKLAFEQQINIVSTSITKSGIVIYRWTTQKEQSAGVTLGSIFGLSGNKAVQYNGFALVGGLRLSTLYLGNELLSQWSNLERDNRYNARFQLTTHVMQAKHIVYLSEYDMQSKLSAQLDASYSQLKNLPETIKKLDRIEIDGVFSKISNLSNLGVISGGTWSTKPVDWSQQGLQTRLSNNGWQTFYSVDSRLGDLLEMLE
jgi:hypothetical protein